MSKSRSTLSQIKPIIMSLSIGFAISMASVSVTQASIQSDSVQQTFQLAHNHTDAVPAPKMQGHDPKMPPPPPAAKADDKKTKPVVDPKATDKPDMPKADEAPKMPPMPMDKPAPEAPKTPVEQPVAKPADILPPSPAAKADEKTKPIVDPKATDKPDMPKAKKQPDNMPAPSTQLKKNG